MYLVLCIKYIILNILKTVGELPADFFIYPCEIPSALTDGPAFSRISWGKEKDRVIRRSFVIPVRLWRRDPGNLIIATGFLPSQE